jgi:beta-lactamase class A
MNLLRTDRRSRRTDRRSRRLFGDRVRRRRRFLRALMVLLAFLVGIVGVLYTSGGELNLPELSKTKAPPKEEEAQSDREPPDGEAGSEPIPEQTEDTPAAVAYGAVAPELPGVSPEDVQGVYQSKLDPSWASVRIELPEEERGTYVLFLQRADDSWETRRSIRADEPEYPEYERSVLDGVPKDLVGSLYPQSMAAAEPSGLLLEPVEAGSLPPVEAAEVPPAEASVDEVPEDERARVDEGLEEARQVIEDYGNVREGVAGVYAQDLKGGHGYGVNPDEVFFGASVIKVPIMVAVYRRMDEGAFSSRDMFETKPEDWAGGAGWLQWEEAGTAHTVEDYLLMMMTQSDNVATNALMRAVGGPEYVNQVSASLGATDTVIRQKVTSERAAVPSLDNQTTPRDMAAILGAVAAGRAASPESCEDMMKLMYQNTLESGLQSGLPEGTEVAYKGGWLYKVYDEAGFIWHEDRPYVVAIFSKHGTEDPKEGKILLENISAAVWQAQDGSQSSKDAENSEETSEDAEILDDPGSSEE